MPNLDPPLTSIEQVSAYIWQLQPLDPRTTFLMTLYLHPTLTPSTIETAAWAGIHGIKAYPANTTTNSASGVSNWDMYTPILTAMQEHNLVLNIHGETPGASPETAESAFLPTLLHLHGSFPRLRIVLEHATSAAALDAVASCGANVATTITAHHLYLTRDAVPGNPDNYCRPLAKLESDRRALLRAVLGVYDRRLRGRVLFGSDSAPHDVEMKRGMNVGRACCGGDATAGILPSLVPATEVATATAVPGAGAGASVAATQQPAAGCFTQPFATQLVVGAVDQALADGWVYDQLENDDNGFVELDGEGVIAALTAFLSGNAARFYKLNDDADGNVVFGSKENEMIELERGKALIPMSVSVQDGDGRLEGPVVNCFRGGEITWGLKWIDTSHSASD